MLFRVAHTGIEFTTVAGRPPEQAARCRQGSMAGARGFGDRSRSGGAQVMVHEIPGKDATAADPQRFEHLLDGVRDYAILLLDIEVLFDSDQPDISLDQPVDQGNHFRGAAAKPAQLSDNQGIGFVKQLQKFIDPALLTGFARRDRHFDKLVNLDAPFSGKFQKHQLLVI